MGIAVDFLSSCMRVPKPWGHPVLSYSSLWAQNPVQFMGTSMQQTLRRCLLGWECSLRWESWHCHFGSQSQSLVPICGFHTYFSHQLPVKHLLPLFPPSPLLLPLPSLLVIPLLCSCTQVLWVAVLLPLSLQPCVFNRNCPDLSSGFVTSLVKNLQCFQPIG